MTGPDLPIAPPLAAAAQTGQWCPKLCSHTCPVLRATGRHDAVPWSFHRTVADLVDGRLDPAAAGQRLVACTGCRACAGGCDIAGQDVPAQVRAGRAAVRVAGAAPSAVTRAEEAVARGVSPFGVDGPAPLAATRADVVLVVGCRDRPATITAAVRLLAAAHEVAEVVVPEGCCGESLRDLGATEAADAAQTRLRSRLDDGRPLLLADPHCRPALGDHADVGDLVGHLADLAADGRLRLAGHAGPVRWHEPCAVRATDGAGRGTELLAAVGALVELPGEAHHRCSGAGLGLPLLDPDAARAVAADRVATLGGHVPLVTSCAGAAASLAAVDDHAQHVLPFLSSLLADPPESVA